MSGSMWQWVSVCGAKEGAEPKRKALDLPVVLPPDPHLWPPAVGSDLKNEITDASGPNELLCCWMCIDRLRGLMVWAVPRVELLLLLHREQLSHLRAGSPEALFHHDTVSNQILKKDRLNVLCLPQKKETFHFKEERWLFFAFLHDSALLFEFILNLSPRSACYIILSPGSGQGRPAVGVGAYMQLCVLAFLSGCLYFPVYLLRLDKVL